MAYKNETPALVLSLVITFGLIGAGIWWITHQFHGSLPWQSSSSPSSGSAPIATGPAAKTFVDVPNVPSGVFNYGGSTSWAPIRGQIDPVIESSFPNFRLRYTEPVTGTPGSSTGIRMLLDNQLTFAQSSRSLTSQEHQDAQQRGYKLEEIPVAIEGIAIAVHPGLNISGLTLNQIKGIYTGQITNWNQVGGPDLSITPYSRRTEDGGTVIFFVENLLAGQPFGSNVKFISTTTAALRAISNDPGGIYYASAPEVVGQCTTKPLAVGRPNENLVTPYQPPLVPSDQCPGRRNQINEEALKNGQYPITRRLFVIVKQNGQVDEQAGAAYANLLLSEQGQDLLSKAGFVRIR
jgi:phosphate transport system substrate-binding protein